MCRIFSRVLFYDILGLYFSETFKKSAEYNCEWATSTTVPLLDQLWIYSGILSRVPQLVEVSEQSQQKIKNNANKVRFDIFNSVETKNEK